MLTRLSAAAAVLAAAFVIVAAAGVASATQADSPADLIRSPVGDAAAAAAAPPADPGSFDQTEVFKRVSWGLYLAAGLSMVWFWWTGLLKPGSLGKPKPPGSPDQPGWAFFVAGFAVYVAAVIGAQMAQAMLHVPRGVSPATARDLSLVTLGYYSMSIPVGLALAALTAGSLKKLFAWRDPLMGLALLALVYPLIFAVSAASLWVAVRLNPESVSPIAHETLRILHSRPNDHWALVLAGIAVVGAPILEEIIYRYFLQTSIALAFGSQWLAVLATAGLFAAAHLGAVQQHALATLFVLGVALSIAYVKTGRLGVCMALHAAFNLLNVLLVLYVE